MVCHLRRGMEWSGGAAEMSVSRENGEKNRALMQWFSVWTMVPASLSVPANGHNLLFSKVSHGVLRETGYAFWEEDLY